MGLGTAHPGEGFGTQYVSEACERQRQVTTVIFASIVPSMCTQYVSVYPIPAHGNFYKEVAVADV